MELSVLGPLRLGGPAGPVPVPGRKARELLTVLALAAPRPLSVDALADRLWDEPPPAAVKTVQAHLSRLRAALAAAGAGVDALGGGPAGYQLALPTERLDVSTVADLRRQARLAALAGDDRERAALLHDARQRWRGEPELPATAAGEAERARWAEEHLLLIEDQLAAAIAAGDAVATVGELEALTAAHPLRERLWALRMEALYRSGRQADALAAYRTARRILTDEVGVEPGPELRALEQAILNHALPAGRAAGTRLEPVTLAADVPRYTDAGGVHIAYGTYGEGGTDVLLLNPTFIPVDAYLEEPRLAGAVAGLAAGRRVIAYDRRGLGLSDPITPATPPTVEDWVADAVAVLDALGAGRVHVLANGDTTLVGLLLAATQPARVATLTLVDGYARATIDATYPHGSAPTELADTLRELHTPDAAPAVDVLAWIAPSVAGDQRFRTWWDAIGRRGASPRTAALMHDLILRSDVRDALPRITTPVLVLSRLGCASYDSGHSRYLAEHLANARLVEQDCSDDPWFLGDVAGVLTEFAAFIAQPL